MFVQSQPSSESGHHIRRLRGVLGDPGKKAAVCMVASGMSTLVERTIAALRVNHNTLAALVPTLSEDNLSDPSGATEWSVAQALSHIGSGAEIGSKPIATAAGERVEAEDNQAIWARWNASSPADQAAEFVKHDEAYLDTIEALSIEQRDSLMIDLGFLPEPVPLLVALGMRLNEVANHAWDVRVGVDPSATVDQDSAELLVELFRRPLAFLLGFSAKPDAIEREVRLTIPGGALEITDAVTVTDSLDHPTATFEGPAEAVVRLLSGRLGPEHAAGVTVTGNVTLDELRKVFPGY
ncbi:uncharacterized protein (TIGR03083 family) [Humibacillus xanthopallidus]|uniref:Uncharacterized protein (TIGR03083 family) n=2 Tax=Humibacillus xanthopallidus TaxID=412689 RepID=A0A543PKN9_9MICO|nr:uncharacterized protein (TIGR03083 family) [Humibacillus xanthopallidus]